MLRKIGHSIGSHPWAFAVSLEIIAILGLAALPQLHWPVVALAKVGAPHWALTMVVLLFGFGLLVPVGVLGPILLSRLAAIALCGTNRMEITWGAWIFFLGLSEGAVVAALPPRPSTPPLMEFALYVVSGSLGLACCLTGALLVANKIWPGALKNSQLPSGWRA